MCKKKLLNPSCIKTHFIQIRLKRNLVVTVKQKQVYRSHAPNYPKKKSKPKIYPVHPKLKKMNT